eukprot:6200780-Pleurochrysis_carterae.AAC.7
MGRASSRRASSSVRSWLPSVRRSRRRMTSHSQATHATQRAHGHEYLGQFAEGHRPRCETKRVPEFDFATLTQPLQRCNRALPVTATPQLGPFGSAHIRLPLMQCSMHSRVQWSCSASIATLNAWHGRRPEAWMRSRKQCGSFLSKEQAVAWQSRARPRWRTRRDRRARLPQKRWHTHYRAAPRGQYSATGMVDASMRSCAAVSVKCPEGSLGTCWISALTYAIRVQVRRRRRCAGNRCDSCPEMTMMMPFQAAAHAELRCAPPTHHVPRPRLSWAQVPTSRAMLPHSQTWKPRQVSAAPLSTLPSSEIGGDRNNDPKAKHIIAVTANPQELIVLNNSSCGN